MTTVKLLDQYFHQLTQTFGLVLDEHLNLVRANQTAIDLIGERLNQYPISTLLGFDHAIISQALTKQHETGALESHRMNIRFEHEMPLTLYVTFIPLESGYLCIGEEKRSEIESLKIELLSANTEINNLLRSVHLKNKELAELNNLKNRFLSIASHDLRNGLGVINGYLSLLLDDQQALDARQLAALNSMNVATALMINLLSNLLDVTQIETGHFKLDLKESDLNQKIQENCDVNRVLANKKGIQLVAHLCERLPKIEMDPDKIAQVLNNLISNALKFSEPGTQVLVSTAYTEEPQAKVILSVKDQGQGIAETELSRIFEANYRSSNKATAGEHSTGLGLSIVRDLVVAHGGEVTVESRLGEGSTFFVSLPLAHPQADLRLGEP